MVTCLMRAAFVTWLITMQVTIQMTWAQDDSIPLAQQKVPAHPHNLLHYVATSKRQLNLDDVLKRLDHFLKKQARHSYYVSFGESHRDREANYAFYAKAFPLLDKYVKPVATAGLDYDLCMEEMTGTAELPAVKSLLERIKRREVYQQSPGHTDFKRCSRAEQKRYLLFSGFFHQVPYAGFFPDNFLSQPASSRWDMSIYEQMKIPGFALSWIDLDFVDIQLLNLLNRRAQPLSYKRWKEELMNTLSHWKKIIKHLHHQNIDSATGDQRTIHYTVLDRKTLKYLPENYYVFLTISEARLNQLGGFIQALLNLSSDNLEQFYQLAVEDRKVILDQIRFDPHVTQCIHGYFTGNKLCNTTIAYLGDKENRRALFWSGKTEDPIYCTINLEQLPAQSCFDESSISAR